MIVTNQARKDLENHYYEQWRITDEASRTEVEEKLSTVLRNHAQAIIYSILRKNDMDLLGESVDKVLLNLKSFRGQSLFTTWAHKVMSGVVYDARRAARAHNKEISLDGLALTDISTFEARDIMSTVQALLSAEDYSLFEAFVLYGYTQQEVARMYNTPRTSLIRRWKGITEVLRDAFTK